MSRQVLTRRYRQNPRFMTEHLLDLPELERKSRSLRRFKRVWQVLLMLLLLITAANAILVYSTIEPRDTVSTSGMFYGWHAPDLFYFLVAVAEPAVALVIASVLAFIPVKRGSYVQRLLLLFLVVAIVIEGVGCRQLIIDEWLNR
jgi:cell division protein FtsW (lipid II flippase)